MKPYLLQQPTITTARRCTDGFPLDLSPLGWARRCRHGDSYSLPARGMAPLTDSEMQAVIDTCAARGLEVFGGDDGMYAQRFDPRFAWGG